MHCSHAARPSLHELPRESRFPDPRLAHHGYEPATTGYRQLQLPLEQHELARTANEPSRGWALRSARGADAEQSEAGERLRLPLHLDGLHGLDPCRVANETVGRLADQHLARGGRLLQAGGHVDRVAEHDSVTRREHLTPRRVPRDHLAGIHPDADPQPRLLPSLQLGEPRLNLERRPASTQRIVLIRPRHPEHPHHRITDELLDRTTVTLQRPTRRVVIRPHQLKHRLRVQPLGQLGRPRQVTEHRRDQPAPVDRRSQRRTTGTTEPVTSRILEPAISADQHVGYPSPATAESLQPTSLLRRAPSGPRHSFRHQHDGAGHDRDQR